MQNPPDGDPTQVRRDFVDQIQAFDQQTSEALLALSVAAMLSRAWVGVEIRSVQFKVTVEKDGQPTRAQMLQRGNRLSRKRPDKTQESTERGGEIVLTSFQQAERDGWCAIKQGYAYPTQKFASFMTAS